MSGAWTTADQRHRAWITDALHRAAEDILSSVFYEDHVEIKHCELVYDHVHASALGVEESRAVLENLIESQ